MYPVPDEAAGRIIKPAIPFYGKEILEMAISDLNIRKPISLFAEFADWRAESGFRQLDKKRNLTN